MAPAPGQCRRRFFLPRDARDLGRERRSSATPAARGSAIRGADYPGRTRRGDERVRARPDTGSRITAVLKSIPCSCWGGAGVGCRGDWIERVRLRVWGVLGRLGGLRCLLGEFLKGDGDE